MIALRAKYVGITTKRPKSKGKGSSHTPLALLHEAEECRKKRASDCSPTRGEPESLSSGFVLDGGQAIVL